MFFRLGSSIHPAGSDRWRQQGTPAGTPRGDEAQIAKSEIGNWKWESDQSLVTSAATILKLLILMLTQLNTVKSRLAIPDTDITQDDLLTFAIEAISARFDQGRHLAQRRRHATVLAA